MSRIAPPVLACLLSVVLLGSCSGGESPGEGGGTPTASDSPSTSTPSDGASPSEEAPEGQLMEVPAGAVTVPGDWEAQRARDPLNQDVRSSSGLSSIGLLDFGPVGPIDLGDFGGVIAQSLGAEDPRITTKGVELAGEPAVRVEATDSQGRLRVSVGSSRGQQVLEVSFVLDPEDVPEAEQQAFVDEVLATYEWGTPS